MKFKDIIKKAKEGDFKSITGVTISPYINSQINIGDVIINYQGLNSLEGCPKEIQGDFLCNENLLESLKHLAKKISGEVQISKNYLTSLKGRPKKTKGFNCCMNKLTSLEGSPEEIENGFDCSGNFDFEKIRKEFELYGEMLKNKNNNVINKLKNQIGDYGLCI